MCSDTGHQKCDFMSYHARPDFLGDISYLIAYYDKRNRAINCLPIQIVTQFFCKLYNLKELSNQYIQAVSLK